MIHTACRSTSFSSLTRTGPCRSTLTTFMTRRGATQRSRPYISPTAYPGMSWMNPTGSACASIRQGRMPYSSITAKTLSEEHIRRERLVPSWQRNNQRSHSSKVFRQFGQRRRYAENQLPDGAWGNRRRHAAYKLQRETRELRLPEKEMCQTVRQRKFTADGSSSIIAVAIPHFMFNLNGDSTHDGNRPGPHWICRRTRIRGINAHGKSEHTSIPSSSCITDSVSSG